MGMSATNKYLLPWLMHQLKKSFLRKRMKAIFPGTSLDELDDPENFFKAKAGVFHRITLNQTKEYETKLKARLTMLSQSHPELYEKLRAAQLPPPLEAKKDVSEILYGV